ncbi:NusG domain II-containing protein [Paenibacillus sp. KQZ6P-2]|uniref:NusG domain II-containing protein n=1 Tax=Paenibacillus mangrovi TaxID=2931978 RepID=A0A9X1WM99_9BACL|nr:NusG domain II-containing protein [Paenibacillus mangrovi]MCJ8011902.1 NusG domain II-containing protein [Paenibacillus mangrovi]
MKRGDLLLITVIVAAALLLMVPRWVQNGQSSEKNHNNPLTAVIKVDGEVYKTVTLTKEEQTIEINTKRGDNLLKVHDYGIEMVDADCPDQICLTFGFKTNPGDTIVCLPHRVIVEIKGTGGEGGGTDAVI